MLPSVAGTSLPSVQIGVGRLASVTVGTPVGTVHWISTLDAVRIVRAAVAVEHALMVGLARAPLTTCDPVLFAYFVKCCVLDTKVVAQELEESCE